MIQLGWIVLTEIARTEWFIQKYSTVLKVNYSMKNIDKQIHLFQIFSVH